MTYDSKKVLVTGATGVQGGAATQALLRSGHSVTAFVRDPESEAAQALARQGVAVATGGLEDLASLEAASAGHDVVFSVQLAGINPEDPGQEQRQARNITTAAQRAGVDQIIHTSVSRTGWRSEYPTYELYEMYTAYWNEKEAAEEVVRQSGIPRWTIIKPAFCMDSFFPGDNANLHPELRELPEGRMATPNGPRSVLAMTNTDEFGAAVAAAVADPTNFHEAEIELGGDTLTYPAIADVISAVANPTTTMIFAPDERWELIGGSSHTGERTWDGIVGYPTRPHHAARYGLPRTTSRQRAAPRQDWRLPIIKSEGEL